MNQGPLAKNIHKCFYKVMFIKEWDEIKKK